MASKEHYQMLGELPPSYLMQFRSFSLALQLLQSSPEVAFVSRST